jgi:NAD(P)-dependent dehydrogenase (short-subunit alcohol dehydrogenase family)
MKNKIVMVTGANSGIGRVTASELAKMGATVVMVCRNEEKGRAVMDDINAEIGMERVHLLLADFSRHSSIKEMAQQFRSKFDRLDILVNNAGVIVNKKQFTPDGFEWMMGVNHLGYFLTTHYLLELMPRKEGARIINVSSAAHRFAKLDWDNLNAEKSFNSMRTYGLSKLANILFTKYLAKQLENDGITVNCLHPGVVHTNFGKDTYPAFVNVFLNFIGDRIMLSAEQGARTSIYLASSPEVAGYTGQYFARRKRVFPSSVASDPDNALKMWQWSMTACGIKEYGKVNG